MCLLALVLGVFGAVYFERNQSAPSPEVASAAPAAPMPAAPQPAPPGPIASAPGAPAAQNQPPAQAVTSPESTPSQTASPQTAAAPQPPVTSPPQTAQAPATPPPAPPQEQAQVTAPPAPGTSPESLARISPSAAPANIAAAAPRYWVEFGAYTGSLYADRLKQSLDKLGVPATVTTAPGRHGRDYLRVRSAADTDRDAALAQLAKAQTALRISPLLHRIATTSAGAERVAKVAPASASGSHWVQFGAFRSRANAEQVLSKLRKNDVQVSVLERKSSGKESLYLVRTAGFSDRAEAEQVAQRGSAALHSQDFFIGESPGAEALHPRPPPH